jgi:hypothetical protein
VTAPRLLQADLGDMDAGESSKSRAAVVLLDCALDDHDEGVATEMSQRSARGIVVCVGVEKHE